MTVVMLNHENNEIMYPSGYYQSAFMSTNAFELTTKL